MTNIDPSIRLALGLAAARAIRADLPADGYGNLRRLQDDADLWGVAARDAILNSPEFAAAVGAARAEGEKQGKARVREAVADWGNDYFGCIAWPPGSCGHSHHDDEALSLRAALEATP